MSSPHEQRENCSTDRADEKLAGNCRSNAKLFEMIVTPDLAHERKKRTRRNEHRKAIADDEERCRDAERSEQKHRRRHHDCGHESGQQPGENRFCFAHDVADLTPAFLSHKRCSVRCPQRILLRRQVVLR